MNIIFFMLTSRFKASTITELLLTMIISGVIFLLVFDGVEIIKRFSHMVNNRIKVNHNALYSHQTMEYLVENADSITLRSNNLVFYRNNSRIDSVIVDESSFKLKSSAMPDILFEGYLGYRVTSVEGQTELIDSIFINYIVNARDTIWLEYSLPYNRYAYLNHDHDHEYFY